MLEYKHLKDKINNVKTISIQSVLAEMGHYPLYSRQGGRKLWYSSPLQTKVQKTPSFMVDVHSNTWGDFANGATNGKTGGDILDLVRKLKNLSLTDALGFLQGKTYSPFPLPQIQPQESKNELQIRKIQPLQNKALTDYLKSRCINVEIAKLYLEEIYYYQGTKHFFGLAFKNRSNGYETRNKYSGSKRCIGEKDVTYILQNSTSISIFEGFSDFLSVLSYKQIKRLKTDVLVLNSTAMLSRAIPIIQTYQKAFTFLDNDNAGEKTTHEIGQIIPVKTMNYLYTGFKDFNDFLMNQNTVKCI